MSGPVAPIQGIVDGQDNTVGIPIDADDIHDVGLLDGHELQGHYH